MSLFEVSNIAFSYEDIPSLTNISFCVREGDFIGVAGANGSGKSTLMQLMATIIKPDSGDILLNSCSIYKDLKDSRKQIGMVFQNPDDQLFMPSVWEDVAFGVLNQGVSIDDSRGMAMDTLKILGIEHLADRGSHRLSGGEKQKVALGSILVMNPKLLILDEPSSALDPKSRRQIIELLADVKCTKIMATHDLDMALDVCNRMIFLHNGRVAGECGTPGLLHDKKFLESIDMELPLSTKIT